MENKIVFLVTRPEFTVNVVIEASDREIAKRYARHILGGDSDYYVVTPITERGTSTVFLLGGTR